MLKSNQKYPSYSFTTGFEVELFKYKNNEEQSSSSAYISGYPIFHHWLFFFQLIRVSLWLPVNVGCLHLPVHFSQIPEGIHMVLE